MSGHVQSRGNGTWRIWVDDGRDPLTGRRRRVTKTFHGTRQEAEREAEQFVVKVRTHGSGTAALTFGGLLDAWFAHAEPNLAPWTVRGYRSKIETHIRPALGDVKLRQLTTARLDAFYRALLKQGKRAKKGKTAGLSPQSVRHCHTIIHRACEQARRWGWLDRNPAELAEPPSVESLERDLPTVADIARVMEKLTVDMRELVWVALITGARRGELCGLRWSDVDLDHGQVRISQSAVDLPGEETILKAPKTRKARRLAVDALTVDLLRARLEGQRIKAESCSIPHAGGAGYVFADEPGAADPLRPALVTKRWANAARAAKVACRFHDLRHVSVTELLDAGFDVSEVGGRVGHASKVMTLDRYGHSRRAGDRAAAEHLAGLLSPSS